MDRLTAMRVFVEIVDRGSMSGASEALGLSRAMTSRYLEGLEEWLGVRLLHRTTRKLTLSDAGERVLKSCREVVALSEDVRTQVNQSGEIKGQLRIASTATFAQAQLVSAVVDFQLLHPKIEIDLVVVDRKVDLVEERIDVAIRFSNQIDEGLVARKLTVCNSVLCASHSYLTQMGIPETAEDLSVHRIVSHSAGFAQSFTLRLGNNVTTIKSNSMLKSNETSVIRSAVIAGAGIAMLPTYYIGEELRRGELKVVLPNYTLESIMVHAIYLSRKHQPLSLRLFIEFLSERFRGDVARWDYKLSQ